MSNRKFHVIIVGASIAGLTLAHCLSSANVDFTILEARANQITQGTGLVLQPNGARILDQLGLYDKVLRQAERIVSYTTYFDSGRLLLDIDTRHITSRRTGYPLSIISRQALLSILFDYLPRQDRIRFNQKVIQVAPSAREVTVHTADGSRLSGDIVVGADGVHSIVRSQMWQYIQSNRRAARFVLAREIPLKTSFAGVFGTANPVAGLKTGVVYRTFGAGWVMLIMVGKDAQVFWFISIAWPHSSRQAWRRQQGKTSVAPLLAPFLDKHVSSEVTFGELYDRTNSFTFVPLEESFQNQWSAGRFACIGDATTPNIGQGANCAMETATSLGNYIMLASRTDAPWTEAYLESRLQTWENEYRGRMRLFSWVSQSVARVEAGSNWCLRLLRSYFSYYHAAMGIALLGDLTPQTARVQHLPLPLRRTAAPKSQSDPQEKIWSDRFSGLPVVSTMIVALLFIVQSLTRPKDGGVD
ncbi:FAD-dependent oxidoreductase [Aspergillus fijiensis CBS 313.89]|uniref:FAD/NAD(P)-binding domain-containing protein n=1 Tax=Aspergillus fijiensis CBS 313.89 TaxID=1448319 RepID=A0A8G1RKM3_9EURO|nr:FAD/NAD(P)-binding domain-containing protein [Aspergillus fijiensis CBS 313.89]RAK73510.1 FAD/NAD(P)-binding domain-containing protein [Aspergillus fijiensis CBS 313.89]